MYFEVSCRSKKVRAHGEFKKNRYYKSYITRNETNFTRYVLQNITRINAMFRLTCIIVNISSGFFNCILSPNIY